MKLVSIVYVSKTLTNYNSEPEKRIADTVIPEFPKCLRVNMSPWIPVIPNEREWRLAHKQKPGWLSQALKSIWKSCDVYNPLGDGK